MKLRTCFTEANAQRLCVDYDLDIRPSYISDIILARDTLSCHDNHLCQLVFKLNYAIQSYGLDTNRFTKAYA